MSAVNPAAGIDGPSQAYACDDEKFPGPARSGGVSPPWASPLAPAVTEGGLGRYRGACNCGKADGGETPPLHAPSP